MIISKRLLCISDFVDAFSNVVDIGCDHALVDIYLTLNKSCNCLAIDVNDVILSRARKNILKYHVDSRIRVVVGNGFNDLNLAYDSTLILSGMGTDTIVKILNRNKTSVVICQTNTDCYDLRRSVCMMGYCIADEKIILENNRYYITIKFVRGNCIYSDEDYFLGPILRRDNSLEFNSYIKSMYKKNYLGYIESLKYNKNDKKLYKMMEILGEYIL